MKSLHRIISKVFSEPWLISADRHRSIQSQLMAHMAEPKAGLFSDSPDKKQEPPYSRVDQFAIIPVSGVIGKRLDWMESMCGGYDLETLNNALQTAANDPLISQIVTDWDTPGGTVTGVPETGKLIAEINKRKPVTSYCEMGCYSAGVWMATQAGGFYASESAGLGSIGVYMAFLDESAALEMEGLKMNAIAAGRYKLAGASFKPMTDEERGMFQAKVDSIHSDFRAAVSSARTDMDEEFMDGQTFNGREAFEIGLTDGVFNSLPELLRAIR